MKKTIFLLSVLSAFIFSACNNNEEEVVKDIDGNVYTTIKIGMQEWMVENLKVTHYNDGTPISYAASAEEWMAADSLGEGAWCVYDFEGDAAEAITANSYVTNGALYNFDAVKSGKLAPEGWRVATEDDWLLLQAYFIYNRWNYDESHSGNKIAKAMTDSQYWVDNAEEDAHPGDIGTKNMYMDKNNVSGFSALPAGDRRPNGDFVFQGEQAFWWTSTQLEGVDNFAYSKALSNSEAELIESPYKTGYGFSVRCVRDIEWQGQE